MINVDMNTPPPVLAQKYHQIIREMTGVEDPYLSLKEKFNMEALKIYPQLQLLLKDSDDSFKTLVKLAIAGNIIDFGTLMADENMNLMDEVQQVLTQTPFVDHTQYLKEEIDKANKILYVADNAGEVVFDKLFIEYLLPKKIIFAVRKSPIINDATYSDAEFAGITNLVKVIDNGTDAPGSYLKTCSEEFVNEINASNLIISKGQGNYETLHDEDYNIFFLFRAKCSCIADYLNCKLGDTFVIGKKYEI